MKKTVKPAGDAKIAIAELQSLKRVIVAGANADTAIAVANLMATSTLFSVIGFDGDNATAGDSVKDFTANCSVSAKAVAIAGITLADNTEVSIEATGHGLVTGDYVKLDDLVGGAVELRGKATTITKTDANNFTLDGVYGNGVTAWTSGGSVVLKTGELKCTDATTGYQLMVDFVDLPNV